MGHVIRLPSARCDSGIVRVGGRDVRYRRDRRLAWSFVDRGLLPGLRLTGRVVRFDDLDCRAAEVEIALPSGTLFALLWDLAGDEDLVIGRGARAPAKSSAGGLVHFALPARQAAPTRRSG